MQAGKMADAIGPLEGNQVEFSDAEAAYTQAKLKGIETFIELPGGLILGTNYLMTTLFAH